jgi:hypothetical protein
MRARARSTPPPGAETLASGELVRVLYRLGRSRATGVLTVYLGDGPPETIVLRRGHAITSATDPLGRTTAQKLARLCGAVGARYGFDGGIAAYPPGAPGRQLALTAWARAHLETQLDSTGARLLVRELAGVRLLVRRDLGPDDGACDATDRRILEVMSSPRRLDQIWSLARTPRFRLLSFVHFLRAVGALHMIGVSAPVPEPTGPARADAHRLLGVAASADRDTVKRAYRRIARALHPDLNGALTEDERRALEHRLAIINGAYRELVGARPD